MVKKIHYKQRHFLPRTAFVVAVFLGSLLFLSNINSDQEQEPSSSLNHHFRSSRSLLQDLQAETVVDGEAVAEEEPKNDTCAEDGDKKKNANKTEELMFPEDAFSNDQLKHGAIIFHIIGILYMFYALALVCDEFFVPSLEVIIEKLGVSPDVAGATFMAAGGSAPELFTSVIGVFIAQSDVGIGTIVGSAVFNILFVIAACAFAAKEALSLTAWPLIRDVFFYAISLGLLVGFFMDNKITWYEALILFLWYFAYVGFMKFNEPAEDKLRALFKLPEVNREGMERGNPLRSTVYRKGLFHLMNETINPGIIKAKRSLEKDGLAHEMTPLKSEGIMIGHQQAATGITALKSTLQEGEEATQVTQETQENGKEMEEVAEPPKVNNPALEAEAAGDTTAVASVTENGTNNGDAPVEKPADNNVENNEEEGEGEDPIDMTFPAKDGWKAILVYIISFPIMGPLFITLPDTKNEKKKKFFYITFIGSILWIALYSYLMVWWATITGKIFGIPDVVMGLTFLAAGTSVPDLITSVLVAKQGKGDMAVSSSVGSNIFDVTVGLPFPWLLSTMVKGPVAVNSGGVACSIGLLFLMLVLVFLSIIVCKWKMTRPMGVFMGILYIGFVIVSVGLEGNECSAYRIVCPFGK